MSFKCPIIFGPLSKMLLIPFILAINQIIYNIFILYFPGDTSQLIESYSISFGHMLTIFIPRIKFFSVETNRLTTTSKDTDKNKTSNKWCFHYSLLGIFYFLEILLITAPNFLESDDKEVKLPHVTGPFSKESLIVIFIAVLSFFLLKYRYYMHNNVSLVFFIIMGIIIDLILEKFTEEFVGRNILVIIINLFEIMMEVVNACYQKYMMDVYYHRYYNIVFTLGLVLFIWQTVTIPFHIVDENLKTKLIDSFDDVGLLITRFFINMILQFNYFLLRILTISYFTPTHLLICLSVSKFLVALIQKESSLKYLSIIPFGFQFFSLMVYLEIIELNFCGLNKNTKRNIELRGTEDLLQRNNTMNSTNSEGIEYTEGYYINPEHKKKETKKENNEGEKVIFEMQPLPEK